MKNRGIFEKMEVGVLNFDLNAPLLEPGLTYLKKEQVITQSYLNKAKKDFGFNPKFKSTDEKHQTFTYKEYHG